MPIQDHNEHSKQYSPYMTIKSSRAIKNHMGPQRNIEDHIRLQDGTGAYKTKQDHKKTKEDCTKPTNTIRHLFIIQYIGTSGTVSTDPHAESPCLGNTILYNTFSRNLQIRTVRIWDIATLSSILDFQPDLKFLSSNLQDGASETLYYAENPIHPLTNRLTLGMEISAQGPIFDFQLDLKSFKFQLARWGLREAVLF